MKYTTKKYSEYQVELICKALARHAMFLARENELLTIAHTDHLDEIKANRSEYKECIDTVEDLKDGLE